MHASTASQLVLSTHFLNPSSRYSHLLKLPIELICHSLSFLDMDDLLTCSMTCRSFNELIADSPRLQYIIELGSHQMVSVSSPPGMSIAAQRKLLRDREERWKSVAWKGIHPTHIPGAGSIYEFVGGVYGNGHGTGDDRRVSGSITFYQLPETGPKYKDRIPVPSWTLSGFDLNIIDFSIDPTQDLLVLVASAQPGSKCNYQVHLRTLSTNEPHPKAPTPVLDCRRYPGPETADMWTSFRIQVLGKYLAVLIKDVFHTNAAFVAIWNWHVGASACCTMPLRMGIDDFCFLSPSEYMIVIPRGYLDIYSFKDPAIHKDEYPVLLRRFSLPRLQPGYYYWYISATANPIPGAPHLVPCPPTPPLPPYTDTHSPDMMPFTACTPAPPPLPMPAFHARPDDGLIACSLGTLNPSTHAPVDCYVFFIRARLLLDIARSNGEDPAPEEAIFTTASRAAGTPKPSSPSTSSAAGATATSQGSPPAALGATAPAKPHKAKRNPALVPSDLPALESDDSSDDSSITATPARVSSSTAASASGPLPELGLFTPTPASQSSFPAPFLSSTYSFDGPTSSPGPSSAGPSHTHHGSLTPTLSSVALPSPSASPTPASSLSSSSTAANPPSPPPAASTALLFLPSPPTSPPAPAPPHLPTLSLTVPLPAFPMFPPTPPAFMHAQGPATANVAWADWGPHATRWFGDMLSSDWQHAVHGFRTVERVADGEGPRHRIRVRDYNPIMVGREKYREEAAKDKGKGKERAEDGGGKLETEDAGVEGKSEGLTVRLVTEPSTIRAGVAFAEDVVSWLPYREVVTENAIEVSDVMLDDNRILCLKRGQEGQLSSMDVLTF